MEKTTNKTSKKRAALGLTSAIVTFAIVIAGAVIYTFATGCVHVWDDGVVKSTATCTEEGSVIFTCQTCGATQTESSPILEHVMETVISLEATCGQDGETRMRCNTCSYEVSDVIPATNEHDYIENVIAEATCTSEGLVETVCSVCNKTDTGTIGKTDHTMIYAVIKESTCTTQGERIGICSVCNFAGETEASPLNPHEMEETLTSATCRSEGLLVKCCTACDYYEENVIPRSDHSYAMKTLSASTCTEEGVVKYTCSDCGDSYTENTEAVGHRWIDATCTSAKRCSVCFTAEDGPLGHTTDNGICERCGHDFTKNNGNQTDTEESETDTDTEETLETVVD